MASVQDIVVAASINLLAALAFLLAFAFLRLQPFCDRVYFPKWYKKGIRESPKKSGALKKFVNLDFRTYLRFWKWMPEALRMPEPELIEHAGLDAAVCVRIYLLGFIAHIAMAYVFTFWTCYSLYREYKIVMTKRLEFLAAENRRPDQFTVLVRNVPPDPDESVSEHVEHFFCVNHADTYLMHQVVYNANKLATLVETKERWGAAVCAQTQQSSNPTIWLTECSPEPRNVYWENLAIPYVELAVKRLLMAVAMFFLPFFFMIHIAFVQSMASIEGIERERVKSVVQGFLPGIALKIFLVLLPTILMSMSKVEGLTSFSSLDRRTAGNYHLLIIVNVFFGSIITGAAFEQLQKFLNQAPSEYVAYPLLVACNCNPYTLIPRTVGVAIPMKATFFITYIMVDGWAGIAAEIINVYDQKYESAASFWLDIHRRVIIGLIMSQLLLMGLLSRKGVSKSTPVLLVLPALTIWFHRFCKGRFESAFVKFPLQDAVIKDTLEKATEPNLNLKAYLHDAYTHPVFKPVEAERTVFIDEEENNPLVTTKRTSRRENGGGGGDGGGGSKPDSGRVTPRVVLD
ncbi:hypothetical protein SASPL_103279 [Salvia splendens]|uniref:Uncharacterized protein n=1 Tax=Salvia splendens TaxID=180675 RepID=A0A8X8YV50_SALSN|nr:hypothetical protein SASPL_103279 [Salvia splendens]